MKKDMQQAAPVIPQLHEQEEEQQHQQRSDVKIESSSTSTSSAAARGGEGEGGASSSGGHHHSNDPSFDHQQAVAEMGMNWEEADAVLGSIENGDLLNVDDAFMSYEDFPPLPDFPCISSNSSSSSSNSSSSAHHHQQKHASSLVTRTSSISSSSASSSACSSASWARIKSDHNNNGSEEADIFSSNTDHDHQHASLLSSLDDSMDIHDPHEDQGADDIIHRMNTADCMDVMEGLGDMGLLDPDELWDPSSLFPPYDEQQDHQQDQQDQDQKQQQQILFQQQDQFLVGSRDNDDDDNNKEPSEDLAMVFLEWLKSNKESISAEDLRSIKLKRSTIECAAKRLGGGKEGMKQLVKLILEWVQNHHLQKRRLKEAAASGGGEGVGGGDQEEAHPFLYQLAENQPPQNPNLCFPPASPWASSLPHPHQQPPFPSPQAQAYFPPMFGYMHGTNDPNSMFPHPPPFSNNPNLAHVNPYSAASSASTDHYNNMFVDSSSTSPNWPQPQPPPPPPPPPPPSQHFPMSTSSYHQDSHLVPPPPPPPPLSRSFSNYPCQVFQGSSHGEGSLIRLGSSATKEARKKRMARQRKVFSHHRSSSTTSAHQHHHHSHQQQQQHQSHHQMPTHTDHQQQTSSPNLANNPQAASNWVYWPSSPTPSPVVASIDHPPLVPMQQNQPPQQRQQQIALERRHGCKPAEKNLKFLLQKVLKQSDVGNLGRIVLPKKEAETYLPELEARDGISIAMEDIGTSRVWNMRYRFWPNNKSRMYLLENTGDFVRSNGLQEGDFIVIYSDIKCGKYMIRGVKVRQPGSKCETKKSSKAHRNMNSNSMGFDGSSPIKQAVT